MEIFMISSPRYWFSSCFDNTRKNLEHSFCVSLRLGTVCLRNCCASRKMLRNTKNAAQGKISFEAFFAPKAHCFDIEIDFQWQPATFKSQRLANLRQSSEFISAKSRFSRGHLLLDNFLREKICHQYHHKNCNLPQLLLCCCSWGRKRKIATPKLKFCPCAEYLRRNFQVKFNVILMYNLHYCRWSLCCTSTRKIRGLKRFSSVNLQPKKIQLNFDARNTKPNLGQRPTLDFYVSRFKLSIFAFALFFLLLFCFQGEAPTTNNSIRSAVQAESSKMINHRILGIFLYKIKIIFTHAPRPRLPRWWWKKFFLFDVAVDVVQYIEIPRKLFFFVENYMEKSLIF